MGGGGEYVKHVEINRNNNTYQTHQFVNIRCIY